MINQNTYKFCVDGIVCPVDGEVIKYEVTWTTEEMILIERLTEWIDDLVQFPMFQEDFAQRFWKKWQSENSRGFLKVEGIHSGVQIICEMGSHKFKP
tara:strand:- start:605 stop:895 length:291 start_codon:yes stop_codon:yes gene_type:complete